jgi:ADP-ribose pyrophosphatase
MSSPGQAPKINRIGPLSPDEAKWTELRKIEACSSILHLPWHNHFGADDTECHQWTDQDGKDRVWEAAARKTRSKGGIDAVAIAPILRHPSRPLETMVILQYRPPVDAFCVEFPAGLIDEGETPEQAAIRELKEETGYEGKVCDCTPMLSCQPGMTNANMQVLDCSPTIVADPGLTNANMQVRAANISDDHLGNY